jgi:large exoprotein involved in heme utilization and adhesion
LFLNEIGVLSTSTFGQGNAGDITIDINGKVELNGSYIDSFVETDAIGNGGNIKITAGSLSLSNGSTIDSSTSGQGNAGQIEIATEGAVGLTGDSDIFNTVNTDAIGSGGSVEIITSNLFITDDAAIDASTYGEGNAGNITLNVSENINLDETSNGQFITGIFNTVNQGAKGNGGSLEITTSNLSIINGAAINAGTYGEGDGGSISVNAQELISLDGTTPDGQFGIGIFKTVIN